MPAFRHPLFVGLFFALFFCLVTSCKVSPPDSGGATSAKHLELTLSSLRQVDSDSFPNSDDITISVRLLDASNTPVGGELISVSSTLGVLTSDLILTNAQGYATTKISSSDIMGAGTITATFGTVTSKYNFELLALLPPAPATAKINLSLLRSGIAINRFKGNEIVQLKATVTDSNNVPLPNKVVTFTAELGTTDVATGLTDQNGVAQVNLSGSDTTLGAAAALATVTINGVDLAASVSYEIINSAIDVKHLELTLSSLLQVDSDSFPNSDDIAMSVRLLDADNSPVGGELISVSSTLGTLTSDLILTNAQGYATTKISSSDTVGAGTITATFGTVTSKYNFELLALPPPSPAISKISLSLLRSGITINRFKSNEIVQLQATVTDSNNVPLPNKVVTFTAELGTTDVATGLTDQNGVAQVNLSGSDTTLGAAAALATVTINGVDLAASVSYEIINSAINITDQVVKLGHFDSSNQFVENALGVSIAADSNGDINISAGGTLGISLAIVDENNQRIMPPSQVNFISSCATSQKAHIGTGVFTVNGVANTTYEDVSCGGGQDVIQATVTVNNQTKSLVQTINIAPENIGSIEFVSSVPQSIVLKGTGGQGQQETSTLTFLVKGALGNPLGQQAVTFSLNTSAGNLTITPATSITNSQGLVTTKVNAGNVPTAVRVTAAVTTASNQVIQTQSDLLSVNTGMPDQDSVSISTEIFNPETDVIDGTEVDITARLADAFNNPVPDGTTVNFTTEGGNIVPTCNTTDGACTVTWTSSEPRVDDHRITILATAVGHETFNDTNGNNSFDSPAAPLPGDGVGFTSTFESGFRRVLAAASGFFDMSEAWRDDNENNTYEPGEKFIDFNNNQNFDGPDGLFNGPQCAGNLCGMGTQKSLHVRKALVLIMSGGTARMTLTSSALASGTLNNPAHLNGRYVYVTNDTNVQPDVANLIITEDNSESFVLTFADFGTPFGQTLPAGTTVQVTASAGTLTGVTSYIVPNWIGPNNSPIVYNGQGIGFTLTSPNTAAAVGDVTLSGMLTMKATTPKGVVTTLNLAYSMPGS